jgi:hypothetical protein
MHDPSGVGGHVPHSPAPLPHTNRRSDPHPHQPGLGARLGTESGGRWPAVVLVSKGGGSVESRAERR